MWPETFSHMGAAPLPVEEWEAGRPPGQRKHSDVHLFQRP